MGIAPQACHGADARWVRGSMPRRRGVAALGGGPGAAWCEAGGRLIRTQVAQTTAARAEACQREGPWAGAMAIPITPN
jgi:hypothetical protein